MKLPEFEINSHKGERGKLLIIAGSQKYYGAAIFNALAAENAGADLITLYLPYEHMTTAKNYSLNLFLHAFVTPELGLKDIGMLVNEFHSHHAVLIGSGIGTERDTMKAVRTLIRDSTIPIVIDGDALQRDILDIKRQSTAVITPHRGEFKRLFGVDASHDVVCEMAQKYNVYIVCKGSVDHIASPQGEYYANHTGCPQMRVGGTGDALCGIIASYIAQGLPIFDACKSACHYFGAAGQELVRNEYSITALKLINHYPRVCK